MQGKLYLPFGRPYAVNYTEAGVVDVVVRVPVTDKVEGVEEVGSESHYVLMPDVEIFKQGKIRLAIAGSALDKLRKVFSIRGGLGRT